MLKTISEYKAIWPIYLSLFLFMVGYGFLISCISISLDERNFTEFTIGIASSIYYIGIVLGSNQKTSSIIIKYGHKKSYIAISIFSSIVSFAFIISDNLYFWFLLLLLSGFFTGFYYVIVESWLMCIGKIGNRGKLIAIYITIFGFAESIAQFLLNTKEINFALPYIIIGIFCLLSILPIFFNKIKTVDFKDVHVLNLSFISSLPRLAVVSSLICGMMMGSSMGLMPKYLKDIEMDYQDISFVMFLFLLGSSLLQPVLGFLSDKYSSKKIIPFINLTAFIITIIYLALNQLITLLPIIAFFNGGLLMSLYPISLAMACDEVKEKEIVSTTQIITLIYGVGSVAGPLLAPVFIKIFGVAGLMYFLITCLLFLLLQKK